MEKIQENEWGTVKHQLTYQHPVTRGLKQQELIFSWSWKLEIQGLSASRAVSSEPSPWPVGDCVLPVSLGSLPSICLCSNPYKDTSPVGYSSVQFSRSVVSEFLRPHGLLQHTRPPCPSPTPRAYSNSCPLGQWCHPTISSSVVPFFSCLKSFPASGSFQMSQLVASGGLSIKGSASASVFPMNTQGLISFIKQSLITSIHGRDQ